MMRESEIILTAPPKSKVGIRQIRWFENKVTVVREVGGGISRKEDQKETVNPGDWRQSANELLLELAKIYCWAVTNY